MKISYRHAVYDSIASLSDTCFAVTFLCAGGAMSTPPGNTSAGGVSLIPNEGGRVSSAWVQKLNWTRDARARVEVGLELFEEETP